MKKNIPSYAGEKIISYYIIYIYVYNKKNIFHLIHFATANSRKIGICGDMASEFESEKMCLLSEKSGFRSEKPQKYSEVESMLITANGKTVNTEQVFCFSIDAFADTTYALIFHHSMLKDNSSNPDGMVLKYYCTEQEAKTDLKRILGAYKAGLTVVDLDL